MTNGKFTMDKTLGSNLVAHGGGNKGHTPVDAPNSFVTKTTARVQFLTSSGENSGLADQTNPLKSVYLNNVQVQNSDGSFNFSNISVQERYGLPSQTVMDGFPAIAASYTVGTKVLVASPVTYTSTTANVDAIRVTVRFPSLFQQENNGDTKPTTVVFEIYTRLTSGSFALHRTITKTDKCIAPADADFYVPRPAGTGTWQVRINRVTADNSTSKKSNDIFFQTATELQLAQLPYNNRAYVGLTLTAETTGQNFPTVAFHYKGRKVRVPSNYNATTRTYSGGWAGTWSETKYTSSNPVWNLLDMLTDPLDGLGLDINDIDIYSFYDAAYYADERVPRLVDGVISGTECRYSFDYQYIDGRSDEWVAVQELASVAGCSVYTAGNLVKLVQDRPTASSRVISNSNVVDGLFTYTSSSLPSRTTACIVYWSDPLQNGVAVPAYYEDADAINRYGLNVKEITAFGCTTEGQAMRMARWNVETALQNSTTCSFKVGLSNAGLMPGEVVSIADSHYQGVTNEGRVVSTGSGTVTIDHDISVTSGHTLTVVGGDGTTLETRTVSATTTGSTISYSGGALTCVPGAAIIVTAAIAPRQFKIVGIQEERTEDSISWTINTVLYAPGKFADVDDTPGGVEPVYQVNTQVPSAPLNLSFLESSVNDSGVITRKLLISWTRPALGQVVSYLFRMRRSGGPWEEYDIKTQSFELNPANSGTYQIEVHARNIKNVLGPKVTGTYDVSIAGAEVSAFDPVTNLVEYKDGTTIFSTDDLAFRWTNPLTNATKAGVTARDFEVRIKTTGGTLLRTFYVEMVPPGSTQYTIYSYQNNVDDGGPHRTVVAEVRIRDTNNNLSDELAVTFTNTAPGIPPNLNIVAGVGSTVITYDNPGEKDFEGVLIWRSATKGFTPSIDTLIFDGVDTYVVDGGLAPATKYYYIVAAYDSFAKTYDGAGLNLSSEVGVTVVDNSGQANKVRNSDFELPASSDEPNRPKGFFTYAFPAVAMTPVARTGFGSNKAFAIRVDAPASGNWGLGLNSYENSDGFGIAGGWEAGRDYVISFYAKKEAGAGLTNIEPAWSFPPEFSGVGGLSIALLNPVLTTAWQRYAFHIRWAPSATVEADGGLYLAVQGSAVPNDIVLFDRLQVELGEAHSGWQPRLEELGPNSITETMIQDDSITTPKLVTGAVIADKLASNSVTTEKLVVGAVIADKIAANAITSEKLVTGAVSADKIAANAITSEKVVVGAITKTKLTQLGDVNLIDTKSWNQGMTMPPPDYAINTSGTFIDSIVLAQHPDNRLAPVWKSTSTSDTPTWGGMLLNNPLTIDPTKTYRFVIWFKNSVLNTSGVTYHGPSYGYDATVLIQTLAGVDEPNPYFNATYRPDVAIDRWYASIGYIFPYNATGLSNQGGVYDGTTMQKVFNGTDYKFKATTTALGMRAVVFNSANTSVTYFCKPRIDIVDGSEASLQEILASGGVSGYNPINAANQSVIIADGAITAAKMNVTQLSAVSANIGVLRTASSGQRVEVRDNQILVYDSSNVVRVKIGDLT